MPSHSLLGQLYGPERDIVTTSHSLLGQLYGPQRDDVTLLIGPTLWPRIYVANNVTASKNGLFPDGVTGPSV